MRLRETLSRRPHGFPPHPKGPLDWSYIGLSLLIPCTAWIIRTHILHQPQPAPRFNYITIWFFSYSILCGLRMGHYRKELSGFILYSQKEKYRTFMSRFNNLTAWLFGTASCIFCGLIMFITIAALFTSLIGFSLYDNLNETIAILSGIASAWYWFQILFNLSFFKTPRAFVVIDDMSFSEGNVFALYPWQNHRIEILHEEPSKDEFLQ